MNFQPFCYSVLRRTYIYVLKCDFWLWRLGEHDYAAFFPADVDEDSEEANVIIMFRIVEENGEELLETIDDDEEAELVYEKFTESLFDDEEEE